MTDLDPYAAPQTDPSVPVTGTGRFAHLDFKGLQKLYYRSCNVTGIAVLLILGLLALSALLMIPFDEPAFPHVLLIAMVAFYAITIVGLLMRTEWGRIMGIIVCVISLLSIPIGTIIGLFGLFAFFGAPELFGNDRIPHKDLKAEFKRRKAERKVARRNS